MHENARYSAQCMIVTSKVKCMPQVASSEEERPEGDSILYDFFFLYDFFYISDEYTQKHTFPLLSKGGHGIKAFTDCYIVNYLPFIICIICL